MMFPTTSILDNFNRADENPLGNGTWTGPLYSGDNQMQILSNQAAPISGVNNESYWSAGIFGPDCEAWFTVVTGSIVNSTDYTIDLRMLNPGTVSLSGYELTINGSTGVWTVSRIDNAVSTPLGATITQAVSNGDAIGMSMIGSTITVYYKPSGGSWAPLGTRTDSTYTAAGRIAFGAFNDSAIRYDDFGGGTVVVVAEDLLGQMVGM